VDAIEDSEGVRARLVGGVLVFHHYAPLVPATVPVIAKARRAALAASSHLAVMVVLSATLPAPDAKTRGLLSELLRSNDGHIVAMAYVIVGAGFAAAGMRAAVTGVSLLVRTGYPAKVFATIPEAMLWLTLQTGGSAATSAALAEQAEQFLRSPLNV
jgi:hypothetical protein